MRPTLKYLAALAVFCAGMAALFFGAVFIVGTALGAALDDPRGFIWTAIVFAVFLFVCGVIDSLKGLFAQRPRER